MTAQPASSTRIYTLADDRYFVGLVALLNSLRLAGNLQELVVLDCGLTARQRDALQEHATVVALPPAVASRKVLAKSYLHQFVSPSELAVYIDSDAIVTARLDPILAHAAAGRICLAPVDWPEHRSRALPEWEQLFRLAAPIRPQVYVNAGFFALAVERWSNLLERWSELCAVIPNEAVFRGDISDNALWAGDQDALNALLMSEVAAGAVELLPDTAAVFPPDMERVEVIDAEGLECAIDGHPVTLLHYSWVPKPWQPNAWRRMRRPGRDAYARILPRVLFADDAPFVLDRRDVPAWLQAGAVGAAARRGVAIAHPLRRLGASAVGKLPGPARVRLISLRDRLEPRERG
jgi:hypothetical protein